MCVVYRGRDRESLLQVARQQFEHISAELKQAIVSAAPSATQRPATYRRIEAPAWELAVGDSQIGLSAISVPPDGWVGSQAATRLPFDVIACADITVGGSRNRQGYRGRVHSLWFCDAQVAGEYGWYETAFTVNPIKTVAGSHIPHAVSAWHDGASVALSMARNSPMVAWPFTLLKAGQLSEFIDRWANWLAACAQGTLQVPWEITTIDVSHSWRDETRRSTTPRKRKTRAQVVRARRLLSLAICAPVVIGSCLIGQTLAAQGDQYARYGASTDPNGGLKAWGAIGMYGIAGLSLLALLGTLWEMLKDHNKS